MQRITFISPQYHHLHKSAISPSSSSPHGGCSILNTYYYRNNPANYIYKSAISSSSSSPHGSCSMFVQPDSRQFPQAGEHSMLCFLHVHRRVLQSVMQLHLITRSRFSGAGPRNSFILVVANLLPGARPGSKTNFLVAKLDVHFYEMKIYWYCTLYFHNRAAAVILGCVAERITNITQKCMHDHALN